MFFCTQNKTDFDKAGRLREDGKYGMMTARRDIMKDIPIFTTDNGAASLTLREIPYLGTAYVTIQSSRNPEEFIRECADFCRACGAEHVYATGAPELEAYPLHTAMYHMACDAASLPDTDAALWPVQEETLEKFRTIYNEKMRDVPNAAWMDSKLAFEMLEKGDGYFIHRGEQLLGLGRASGDMLDVVISLIPGAGREVVLALNHALNCDTIRLLVASANIRAIRLYEKLGFIRTAEVSRWYEIF